MAEAATTGFFQSAIPPDTSIRCPFTHLFSSESKRSNHRPHVIRHASASKSRHIGDALVNLRVVPHHAAAEVGRNRSVQSNTAVDDQLRAGNVTRILREQELCCPGHFVGGAEPLQERLGGKRFFKPFQLVSGNADFL